MKRFAFKMFLKPGCKKEYERRHAAIWPELKKMINPIKIYPEDNVRFSIVNMMSYVLDALVNEHMEKMVKNQHGENPTVPCKILAKNEFFKGL